MRRSIAPPGRGCCRTAEFFLARLRRAFLPEFTNPRWLATLRSPGANPFTPPACKPAARKGCRDISPGLSEAIPRGHHDPLHRRTLKACDEIPVEQQARSGGAICPNAFLPERIYFFSITGITFNSALTVPPWMIWTIRPRSSCFARNAAFWYAKGRMLSHANNL